MNRRIVIATMSLLFSLAMIIPISAYEDGDIMEETTIIREEEGLENGIGGIYEQSETLSNEEKGIVAEGTCGESATWTISNDSISGLQLTIAGQGEMHNYDANASFVSGEDDPPWLEDYGNSIKSIVIENGITSIGMHSFSELTNVTSVTIPSSVKVIRGYAFNGCESITNIVIPNGVEEIKVGAFSECKKLRNIIIPESVIKIGAEETGPIRSRIFAECSELESVILPTTVSQMYMSSMFKNCTNLKNVTLPANIEEIGEFAFSGCSSLVSIDIPNSVTKIGQSAFYKCTNLSRVILPTGLSHIGALAFEYCGKLDITFPDTLDTIGPESFAYCESLRNLVIPQSVTRLDQYAFWSCSNLETVKIMNRQGIDFGDEIFGECNRLTEINVPAGMVKTYSKKLSKYASITHDHEYGGEWKNDGKNHYQKCIDETCDAMGNINTCKGGDANCSARAICTSCGKEYGEVNPLVHANVVRDEAVAPSCVQHGKTEGSHCDACHTIILEQKSVAAIGHKWNEGKVTKEPTSADNGIKTYICTVCGDTKSETIAKLISTNIGEWKKDNTGWWYKKADGSYPVNKWELIDGKWYHFDKSGHMQTGWISDGGKWYYLEKSGAMAASKWIGNYYIKADGAMATNEWVDNNKYYVDGNGKWIPGKKQGSGSGNSSSISAGWKKDNTGWWYQNSDGSYPKNAWAKIDGKWYHFGGSGYMQTGWLKDGGKWYYLNSSGAMATGWIKVGGKDYYMYSDGHMAANEWIGKYHVNASGAWDKTR